VKVAAIIPAAGSGVRMGGVNKAFIALAGKPLLQHSIDVFLAHAAIDLIVVALSLDDAKQPPFWLQQPRIMVVTGGKQRADSVLAALRALPDIIDAVVIHDAARPLITGDLIDAVLREVQSGRSATAAMPVTDTLHGVNGQNEIDATPDRARFWRAQTPQAFPRDVLEHAFQASADASSSTDEAGLVAAGGWRVRIVPGEPWNIKVTTPIDLSLAEIALRERNA
jgi:2-C-methyl-D-erythritol 4-phosphate cytidylyltransferase